MKSVRFFSVFVASMAFLVGLTNARASGQGQSMPGLTEEGNDPTASHRSIPTTPPPPYAPSSDEENGTIPTHAAPQPQTPPQNIIPPLAVPGQPYMHGVGRGFSHYPAYMITDAYNPYSPPLQGLTMPPAMMWHLAMMGRPPVPSLLPLPMHPHPQGPHPIIVSPIPRTAPLSPAHISMAGPGMHQSRLPMPERRLAQRRPAPLQLSPKQQQRMASTVAEDGYDGSDVLNGLETPLESEKDLTPPLVDAVLVTKKKEEDGASPFARTPGAEASPASASSTSSNEAMPFDPTSAFVQSVTQPPLSPASPDIAPYQYQSPMNHEARRMEAQRAQRGGGTAGVRGGPRSRARGAGGTNGFGTYNPMKSRLFNEWLGERMQRPNDDHY